jgi:hypothetical protein
MERFYIVAGICYRVTGPDEIMYKDDGVLSHYRIAHSARWDQWLDYEAVETLTQPEGDPTFLDPAIKVWVAGDTQWRVDAGAEICIARCGNRSHVQVKRQAIRKTISPRIVLNSMEAEHKIVRKGGFLLHAAYIRHGEGAILFTAPSGTGKSTQADLWCNLQGAELINGDRVAGTLEADGLVAWGIPYCGTSGICKNTRLPVAAIVYLSQASKTKIQRLDGLQAFRYVWEGCSVNVWDQDDVEKCVQAVMSAVEQVPVYHMACTPDEDAVDTLEEILERGDA